MKCRHCASPLEHKLIDLDFAPASNAYLTAGHLNRPELHYPLRVLVCSSCWLVQTEDFADHGELFDSDYAYFSSTSTTWLAHAKAYTEKIVGRLALGAGSFVVELAANDGYLLQYFAAAGIPNLGVEPTRSTADAARSRGLRIVEEFFGEQLGTDIRARDGAADLIIANNVLAHVPDINDFVAGIAALLGPEGTVTIEFPHLVNLLRENQFDTIYHEHFSYLGILSMQAIFAARGLRIYDVEKLPTHGGSLRVYACHRQAAHAPSAAVEAVVDEERSFGLDRIETYLGFQQQARKIKHDLLAFLLQQQAAGKKVVAYGAAAKGNTLLNYAGVRGDLISMVADAAPSKQGKFLPGSHIPIVTPQALLDSRPDYIIVLPWNLIDEVSQQLREARQWGCKFVTCIPALKIM